MKTRIISGIVAAIFLIGILIFTNIFVIRLALLLILSGSIAETVRCFQIKNKAPFIIFGIIISALLSFMDVIGFEFLMPVIFLFAVFLCFSVVFGYKTVRVSDIASFSLIFILVPFCLSHLIYLRALDFGAYYIWLPLLGAIGADTGAYFIGCGIGGKKLCEALSPKKTIAGSIGAFIGAVVVYFIYSLIIMKISDISINYVIYYIIALLCGGLSQIGDLTASSLKRANNVKDFGKIMPGHGGIFDRVDSLILIAPAVYYVITLIASELFTL